MMLTSMRVLEIVLPESEVETITSVKGNVSGVFFVGKRVRLQHF